eukprot:GHVH01008139.1.p1 GENE.GHVH01008139.1~~GHVH01008139.1.p1  ORF type:complete len:264 (+),score=29.42 GHVH01008139.1:357-1148(+)
MYQLDLFVNEKILEPVLPYILGEEAIKKRFELEIESDELVTPDIPYALEIAEHFLESDSIAPWVNHVMQRSDEDSNFGRRLFPQSQPSSQHSTASQPQQYSATEKDYLKALKHAEMIKHEVRKTFDDWTKHRRTKIFGMMQPGGKLDPKGMQDGAYPSEVISRLYMREHRWVTPIIREHLNQLRLGAYGQRTDSIDVVMATLGLDWKKFSDGTTDQLVKLYNEMIEHYGKVSGKLSEHGKTFMEQTINNLKVGLEGDELLDPS